MVDIQYRKWSQLEDVGELVGKLCFSSQTSVAVVRINTMSVYIKKIFEDCGTDTRSRHIENHSGRVTCCTRLYNDSLDEAVTMLVLSQHRPDDPLLSVTRVRTKFARRAFSVAGLTGLSTSKFIMDSQL